MIEISLVICLNLGISYLPMLFISKPFRIYTIPGRIQHNNTSNYSWKSSWISHLALFYLVLFKDVPSLGVLFCSLFYYVYVFFISTAWLQIVTNNMMFTLQNWKWSISYAVYVWIIAMKCSMSFLFLDFGFIDATNFNSCSWTILVILWYERFFFSSKCLSHLE